MHWRSLADRESDTATSDGRFRQALGAQEWRQIKPGEKTASHRCLFELCACALLPARRIRRRKPQPRVWSNPRSHSAFSRLSLHNKRTRTRNLCRSTSENGDFHLERVQRSSFCRVGAEMSMPSFKSRAVQLSSHHLDTRGNIFISYHNIILARSTPSVRGIPEVFAETENRGEKRRQILTEALAINAL